MRRLEPFHQILVNNLVQHVTDFTAWFALRSATYANAPEQQTPA
jgi:hypothetical protein